MLMLRSKRFPGIDPRSWEHPADRAALAALRALPGFDTLLKRILGLTNERAFRLLFMANAVRVTASQYPRIKTMIDRVVDIFDWPYTPEVFITQSPFLNAGTYGAEKPFIVLNSSILRSLDDDELCTVVAHEMGHVMSGHALYKTMLYMLVNLSLNLIPGASVAAIPVILALREWDRKSELSADRAGLLAVQREEPSYRVLMKLAGGDDPSQLNLNDFFDQAAEYENSPDIVDSVHKLLNMLGETHPFAVIRLRALKTWAVSGQYDALMSGNYRRRDGATDNLEQEFRHAWDAYQDEFSRSGDPLSQAARSIGDFVGNAGDTINTMLGGLFGDHGRPGHNDHNDHNDRGDSNRGDKTDRQ
jgi:Zn-dependent protease with chaperone function